MTQIKNDSEIYAICQLFMSALKQVDVSNLAITGLDITLINIKREVREQYHLREKSQ